MVRPVSWHPESRAANATRRALTEHRGPGSGALPVLPPRRVLLEDLGPFLRRACQGRLDREEAKERELDGFPQSGLKLHPLSDRRGRGYGSLQRRHAFATYGSLARASAEVITPRRAEVSPCSRYNRRAPSAPVQ